MENYFLQVFASPTFLHSLGQLLPVMLDNESVSS